MPRKRVDPKLIALADAEGKALVDFERWYRRLKRAVTGMEKARRKIISLKRQMKKLHEQNGQPAKPEV